MAEVREIIIDFDTNADQTAQSVDNLTDSLQDASETTKEASESTEDYEKSLVDTAGEVKVFGVSLNGMKRAFTGAISQIRLAVTSLKSFKVALASTGIGLIVIALGSLVALFTQTQGGLDAISKGFDIVRVIIDTVIDRLIAVGKGILNILKGNFRQGINELGEAFKGVGDEIRENIKATQDLADATAELRDFNIQLTRENATLLRQIAELRLITQDETKSIEERIEAGQKALDLEKERLALNLFSAEEELRILEDKNALTTSTAEDEQAEAEAFARVQQLKIQSLNTERRLLRELQTLQRQSAREREEQAEILRITNREQLEEGVTETIKSNDLILSNEIKTVADRVNLFKDLGAIKKRVAEETAEAEIELDTFVNEEARRRAIETATVIGSVASGLASFGKNGAIISALINLSLSISRVFAQTGVGGFVAVAPVIAQGLQAIATIRALRPPDPPSFAKGGAIAGPSHSRGGVLLEAEGGEYIINKGAMMQPGVKAVASYLNSLAVPKFQFGGLVPNTERADLLLNRVNESVQTTQTVLVTEDLDAVQNRVTVTEDRAEL